MPKIITAILWCQIILGVTVSLFAYGHIHSAAMDMEFSQRMQREFEQLRQSPEYRDPPPVRSYSFARLIEERYTAARERGSAAMLGFLAGLLASSLAGLLLLSLGRVQRRE